MAVNVFDAHIIGKLNLLNLFIYDIYEILAALKGTKINLDLYIL